MTWATGESYTGEFNQGGIHGHGVYAYPGGGVVRGHYVNG